MASILDDMMGRPVHIRHKLAGRRVTFALEGELAEERMAVEQTAREDAFRAAETGSVVPGQYLVLAALRDGRARFESDLVTVTGLRVTTVDSILSRLREAGDVEKTHVGNFKLWSLTARPAQ